MSSVSAYSRGACVAAPEDSLLSAAQRMEKEGVGVLVVREGEGLAGLLTDRDLALHVAADGHDASRARIADAMSRSPVAVAADAPLEQAFDLLREQCVRRLPVVDAEERLVGVVSLDDLVWLLAREIAGLGEVLRAQLPAGASPMPREVARRAVEHYAREVATSSSSASIAEVAREMREKAVGSVVVLGGDEAVGLVTDRDLALRVVARGIDPAGATAASVMSAPLIAAGASEPLDEIVERMRTTGIRRVPILRDGRPVGIVTFDDLLVAFAGELDRLAGCVAEELRAARRHSERLGLRRELEDRIEDAAAQLRHLGDQTLRRLGGELEQVVERVVQSLRRAGGRAGDRVGVRAVDLMAREPGCCEPEDTLNDAAHVMWERDCGCVPVVAGDGSGRVVGVITDRDICMATYTRGCRPADLSVKEAMATRVHCCLVDDPVSEVLRIMQTARVRRLPVVDADGRLRGIVSLADVVEAAGEAGDAGAPHDADVAGTLRAICRPRARTGGARP